VRRNRCQSLRDAFIIAQIHGFIVNGNEIEVVTEFFYFGPLVSSSNNDWVALHHNLKKA